MGVDREREEPIEAFVRPRVSMCHLCPGTFFSDLADEVALVLGAEGAVRIGIVEVDESALAWDFFRDGRERRILQWKCVGEGNAIGQRKQAQVNHSGC